MKKNNGNIQSVIYRNSDNGRFCIFGEPERNSLKAVGDYAILYVPDMKDSYKDFFEKNGYRVIVLSPDTKFNPFEYLQSEAEVIEQADQIVDYHYAGIKKDKNFLEQIIEREKLLLSIPFLYLWLFKQPEEHTYENVYSLLETIKEDVIHEYLLHDTDGGIFGGFIKEADRYTESHQNRKNKAAIKDLIKRYNNFNKWDVNTKRVVIKLLLDKLKYFKEENTTSIYEYGVMTGQFSKIAGRFEVEKFKGQKTILLNTVSIKPEVWFILNYVLEKQLLIDSKKNGYSISIGSIVPMSDYEKNAEYIQNTFEKV